MIALLSNQLKRKRRWKMFLLIIHSFLRYFDFCAAFRPDMTHCVDANHIMATSFRKGLQSSNAIRMSHHANVRSATAPPAETCCCSHTERVRDGCKGKEDEWNNRPFIPFRISLLGFLDEILIKHTQQPYFDMFIYSFERENIPPAHSRTNIDRNVKYCTVHYRVLQYSIV